MSIVWLALFVVVMIGATWVIVQALAPSVSGDQRTVTADFSDASGLSAGNDVRQMGVRVGRVSSVELHDDVARVTFRMQKSVPMFDNTDIAIRYLNLVGERYLDVFTDGPGRGGQDTSAVIPRSRTIPSFDITALFNGLRPVFKVLNPAEINEFTENILAVVQGRGPDLGSILDKLNQATALVADRSEMVASFVTGLGSVAREIEYKSPRLNELISRTGDALGALATDLDGTEASLTEAAKALKPLRLVLQSLNGVYYGNYGDIDRLLRKYIPATNDASDLLARIPGVLDSLLASVNSATNASYTCGRGKSVPGPIPTVLLAGAPVVICR
ncbi:MlaD family protein [Williamsia sp.]|uniref:MlaD family protein n=1 Tax=Williamsia sp. TaxID=1872085 RepID=UPI0025EBF7E3|nr:MCE family protein [Williamsia sp.]